MPDDQDYEDAFDRFEYLMALVRAQSGRSIPVGRFGWRGAPLERGSEVLKRISSEAEAAGARVPLVFAGLFESYDSFKKAESAVSAVIAQRNWW